MEVNSSSNNAERGNISIPPTTRSATDSATNADTSDKKGRKVSQDNNKTQNMRMIENVSVTTILKCMHHSRFIGTTWKYAKSMTKLISNKNTLAFEDNTIGGSNNLVAISCSKEDLRKACIEMIIIDELPFSFVEKERFRKFISKACLKFIRIF